MTNVDQKVQFKGSLGPWRLELPYQGDEDGETFQVYRVFDQFNNVLAEIKPTVKRGWVSAAESLVNIHAMAKAPEMVKLLQEVYHFIPVSDPNGPSLLGRIAVLIHDINFHDS